MLELSGADSHWRMRHGGDTFNCLWALRALLPAEVTTDYVSAFGDDPFSAGQLTFFAEHGIGTAYSPRIRGGRPGVYAITLHEGERSFTYWRGEAAARCLADDPSLLAQSLEGRALIYFSGITLAILDASARSRLLDAITAARSRGSIVAFDPNYRARLWDSKDTARSAVTQALDNCDIALPTFPDEQALFDDASPDATVQRMSAAGVREIVVKDGSEAALVVTDGNACQVPARPVERLMDTTGAGDSFNGAYLAARLLGRTPADAAQRAHRVAAAVVQTPGALAPFEMLRAAFADAPSATKQHS